MNFAKGVLGDARVKSKEQAADGTASDDNTMDKLSTNVESEHHNVPEPQEKSSPETEQTSDQYLSLKKKQKAAGPLGPDQMKKELYKKLDSNMDWIKKRLAKDMENTKAQKPPTKVFYKDAVYEVDANQTKTDGDMKQVYRDLKESFNLLYPTDMSDFNHRLRKHAGQAIFQETNGGEDFRFGKTSMRDFAPNGPRKELITPKQKSMMDSKRTFEVGGSPPKTEKKSESKPPNERLHTVSNQSKTPKPSTDLKAAKPIIDSPSSDKLLINTKLTNQKASYSSNEVKPFNDKTGLSSSVARKNQNKNKSDKNQLTVLKTLTEVPKSKPETVRTQEDGEALEQRQIPLIHRSFSNYYMKNFMRTGARLFTKQTQPSDQEEVATKKAEKFNRSHSSKPERVGGSRSASQSHDAHSHHTSLCLESFYKVLLEPQELVKPMSQWLKLFVADMIKTMQDFTNRFPHGAAPPERTVNLPAKDKKSSFGGLLRKVHGHL
jgi:hypothetical protein